MYHHLTQRERYLIEYYLSIRKKQKEIAFLLGYHPSTISREIRRNWHKFDRSDGYTYLIANTKAKERKEAKPKRCDFNAKIKSYVIQRLKVQDSPEQICGRMPYDIGQKISIETIYQFIYSDKKSGGYLYKNLRRQRRQRKKRLAKGKIRMDSAYFKKSIHDRDAIVESKARFGDLEIDTMIGKNHQQALLTIVDRKTKYLWVQKLIFKRANDVVKATTKKLMSFAKHIHTITADNGTEFSFYEEIENKLGVTFYFCDPYASWQRGLNEHTNGLIRQYIPKKTDFTTIPYDTVREIQNRLNNRPRKSLGYKTPKEALLECVNTQKIAFVT